MPLMDIINHRLNNQQLAGSAFKTPKDLVQWMGAMQAQDYAMSKWAVGIRLPGTTEATVEKAIDSGEIIRTHVLRPTWHLVAADDIRWMLELTAPHINKKAASQYLNLELDERTFKKSNTIISKLLKDGNHLTRQEIMTALAKKGIVTNDLRGAHLMFRAELDMIVCNGARKGKQLTYALLDEQVPAIKSLRKDEALAELANRYFSSHGPATVQDFSWWSGLPASLARAGLESIKDGLISENNGEQLYWFKNNGPIKNAVPGVIHLLPAYDEWLISYTDRAASLAKSFTRSAITVNGIFKPVVAVNGRVEGLWKRMINNKEVTVEIQIPGSKKKPNKKSFDSAAQSFSKFIGLPAVVRYL